MFFQRGAHGLLATGLLGALLKNTVDSLLTGTQATGKNHFPSLLTDCVGVQ